jgi:hypothetical protein
VLCHRVFDYLLLLLQLIGNFDPDNLYTNFFTGIYRSITVLRRAHSYSHAVTLSAGNASLGIGATPSSSIQDNFKQYLNDPTVQTAIHARPTVWCVPRICCDTGSGAAVLALCYVVAGRSGVGSCVGYVSVC